MPIFKFKSPSGEPVELESDSRESAIQMLNTHVIPDMTKKSTTFKFKSPTGEPVNIESDSRENAIKILQNYAIPDIAKQVATLTPELQSTPQPEIAPPQSQQLQGPPEPIPTSQTPIAPRTGMPWYQKLQEGVGTGMINTYYGAKNLTGLSDEEDKLRQKQIQEYQEGLGGFGTAGGLVGEGLATAPIGGAVGAGGKLLVKAIPALAKVAGAGGRIANVGTAGRAATEGALSAAVTGGDAVEGGAYGGGTAALMSAAAKPLQLTGKVLNKAWESLAPSGAPARAFKSFERTIGKEGVEDTRRALEHAGPSYLPQTTAAMSGHPLVGALERGAVQRGNIDFNAQKEASARAAWEEITRSGTPSKAAEAFEGKFMREGIPQTPNMYGTGSDRVPELESRPLRQALGQYGKHMTGDEFTRFSDLADDIHKQAIVRTGQGATQPDLGGGKGAVSAGLAAASIATSSPMLWKLGSVFRSLAKSADEKTVKEIDAALLDPTRFKSLVDTIKAKDRSGTPLNATEELLKQSMLGTSRAMAVPSKEKK